MAELVDNASIPLETRITAPITWDIKRRFKIQDLRENKYDEVLLLIKVRLIGLIIFLALFTS
jgi:hypothetical protein